MPSPPAESSELRHVVFDLDGTLADTLPGIAASLRHALAGHAPDRILPELRAHIGPPLPRMLLRMWPDLEAGLCQRIIADFCVHYDADGFQDSTAFPGADQLLRRLKTAGFTLFVLSNKRGIPARGIIKALGWSDLFTEIVTPDSRQPPFASKPEAGQSLMERHRLSPQSVLMVGDGEDDAKTAKACGFAFAHASYGYGSPPSDAICIEKFCDLERLLLIPDLHSHD